MSTPERPTSSPADNLDQSAVKVELSYEAADKPSFTEIESPAVSKLETVVGHLATTKGKVARLINNAGTTGVSPISREHVEAIHQKTFEEHGIEWPPRRHSR